MLITELKAGKTHVQFFSLNPANVAETICLGTIRVEYAETVKAAIEAQMVASEASVANRDDNEIQQGKT